MDQRDAPDRGAVAVGGADADEGGGLEAVVLGGKSEGAARGAADEVVGAVAGDGVIGGAVLQGVEGGGQEWGADVVSERGGGVVGGLGAGSELERPGAGLGSSITAADAGADGDHVEGGGAEGSGDVFEEADAKRGFLAGNEGRESDRLAVARTGELGGEVRV